MSVLTVLMKTAVSLLASSSGASDAAGLTDAAIGLLGGTESDGTKMLVKYGWQVLAGILPAITTPELTDEDVQAALARSLGKEPVKIDLAKLWSGGK